MQIQISSDTTACNLAMTGIAALVSHADALRNTPE